MPQRPHARLHACLSSSLDVESPSETVRRHLPDLYHAVGKDLVERYINEIVEKRLASAPSISRPFSKPPPRARERLDFLSQIIRKAPPEGIRFSEVLDILESVECKRISRQALHEFIRRYMAYHDFVLLSGRVRLKTEAVVELLAREREKKLVEMKREEEVS